MVLLFGDFNARPGSPPYLAIASHGLRDSRQVSRRPAYPHPETGTSTGFAVPPRARGIIDYIFVGGPVDVLSFGVWGTSSCVERLRTVSVANPFVSPSV